MNISFDLIVPPIIAGILITMIVSTNMVMMESSVENQLTYQLQATANNGLLVIQEEVRNLRQIITAEDSTLHFVENDGDTVLIIQNNQYLNVSTTPFGGGSVTSESYYMKLDEIDFTITTAGILAPTFLDINLITKSSPQEQVDTQVFRAAASRSIYLRNVQLSQFNSE